MGTVMSGTTFTSTAVGVDPTPDRWYHVLANLVGATAVGLLTSVALFEIGNPARLLPYVAPLPGSIGSSMVLAPLLGLVLAVPPALAQVRGLLRFGWLVAVIGALALCALRWWSQPSSLELVLWLTEAFVALVAVTLAGVLLAFSAAGLWSRRAIALGFAAAVVARMFALDPVWSTPLALTVAGVTAVAFAVTLTRAPTPSSERASGRPTLVIALVGLGAGLAYWSIALYLEEGRRPDFFPLGEPLLAHDLLTDGGRVLIGLAAIVVLGLVATRRGGASLARWVLAGFGFGLATVIWLDRSFVDRDPTTSVLPWLVVSLSAVVGVFVVARWDRGLPWDAIGMVVLAAGLYLHVQPSGLAAYGEQIALTVIGALTFVLATGLTRLVGPGRALDTGPAVAGSMALGLTGAILGHQVGFGFVTLDQDRFESVLTAQSYALGGIAIALIVLFALGRRRIAHVSTAPPKPATPTPEPALAVTEPQATVPL